MSPLSSEAMGQIIVLIFIVGMVLEGVVETWRKK